ncbi:MAG: hypothetical protein DRH24_18200 [Deltaproteobacteria bacterium]|nr:MAG: hypothetical protein DRH24_18200 [Deltaproteobacteria bacterium]
MPRRETHLAAPEARIVTLVLAAAFLSFGDLPAALCVFAIGTISTILPDLDYAPPRLQHPPHGRRSRWALLHVSNTSMIPQYTAIVAVGLALPLLRVIHDYFILTLAALCGVVAGIMLVPHVVHRGRMHTLQVGLLLTTLNSIAAANFCDFVAWIIQHTIWDMTPTIHWIVVFLTSMLSGMVGYHSHLRLDGVPLFHARSAWSPQYPHSYQDSRERQFPTRDVQLQKVVRRATYGVSEGYSIYIASPDNYLLRGAPRDNEPISPAETTQGKIHLGKP